MKLPKSNPSFSKLNKYPFLTKYAQNGLVNFNALARLVGSKHSLAAAGMELRRYVSKLPKAPVASYDFSKHSLNLVTRTNIHEVILRKSAENRKECLNLVNEISNTKYFTSLVEGEKEIVVMTDKPDIQLSSGLNGSLTSDLAFISVDFPIEMRQIPGIYSLITSALASESIPIHSFHTIGGEILILVKNENLMWTQEVLQMILEQS